MHVLTLSAIALPTWALGTSIAVFVMISLLMIGVILLQRPQGGGLTAAFGGSQGAGQTAFGTKTGDALTIFTCLVFAVYVGAAVFLNHGLKPQAASATPAAPANTSTAAPANPAPANNPAANPTTLPPGVNPGTAPATTPATNPATTPGTTPTTTPGAAPATTPPATTPPATTPPAAVPPATTPATTPSTAPKTPDPAAPK